MIHNILNNKVKKFHVFIISYFEDGLQFRYYYFADVWSLTKRSYLDVPELE